MKKFAFLITITISQTLVAQNVGIGTTTPQTQLHIVSSSNEALRIDAADPYLSLYSSGVYKGYFWKSPISIELGSAAGSNLPITFAPNGNQLMYVGTNGNVGIGTNAPLSKLHVFNGTSGNTSPFSPVAIEGNTNTYINLLSPDINETAVLFGKASDAASGGIVYNNSDNLNGLQFRTNGNLTRMAINNNGHVGIGTTTPFCPLGFGNSSGDIISLNGTASNNYGFGVQLGLLQIHANIEFADIAFGYGSSSSFNQRMRIINTGSTGMELNGRIVLRNGTSSLDVNAAPGIWYNKPDNSGLLGFIGTQNSQNIGFYGGPSNGGWGFVYNTVNGRVGIGTSNPSETLHVEGTTSLRGNVAIDHPGSTHKLAVGGTTTLDGNVGIGTAAGSQRLEVSGPTLLGGPLQINGQLHTTGEAFKPGGGPWFATSDARLKENVLPYTDGLSTLLKINPVKYHYNKLSGYDTKPEYVGVLAQELKSIAPYMVSSFKKNGESYYNVDNSAMTYMLVNAVKEQQIVIDKQQQQIDELKKIVQQLVNK